MSDEYVGDDIDRLIDQAAGVSGGEYVGAGTPQRLARRQAPPQAQASQMQRSERTVYKRAPLGFGTYNLAAAASITLSATVQRAFMADRLLVTASQTGIQVTSIKVGDEEQILGGSVPQETYGPQALADTRADDFTPAPAGIQLSITLLNTAATATTGSGSMKGSVKR